MYVNIFSHLFVIHIIIKSQGLISFLNVCMYVCVFVRCGGVKNVRKMYEGGGWSY